MIGEAHAATNCTTDAGGRGRPLEDVIRMVATFEDTHSLMVDDQSAKCPVMHPERHVLNYVTISH